MKIARWQEGRLVRDGAEFSWPEDVKGFDEALAENGFEVSPAYCLGDTDPGGWSFGARFHRSRGKSDGNPWLADINLDDTGTYILFDDVLGIMEFVQTHAAFLLVNIASNAFRLWQEELLWADRIRDLNGTTRKWHIHEREQRQMHEFERRELQRRREKQEAKEG